MACGSRGEGARICRERTHCLPLANPGAVREAGPQTIGHQDKQSRATAARASNEENCGVHTRHCCISYTLIIAVRNLTAQSCLKNLSWPGERVQCNSALQQCAATYTRACETPSPRRNTAALLRSCETPSTGHAVAASGTPSENVKRIDRARRRRERNAVGNDVRKLQQLRRRELVAAAVAAECWSLRGSRLGALAVPGTLGGDDRVLRLDSRI